VLFATHFDYSRARDAHEDDIHLVVDVLPHTLPRTKAHQICVQIVALFKSPDHPLPMPSGDEGSLKIHSNFTAQPKLVLVEGYGQLL